MDHASKTALAPQSFQATVLKIFKESLVAAGAPETIGYGVLRLVFGMIMVSHGLPKMLGTSHGSMADPMAASAALIGNVLHLPAAPVFAMLVALLETVGGALLGIGLATRPVAALMAVQMLAISYILGPTWPWIDRGIEYPVLMLFLALYMAVKGGGRYSLDHWIGASFLARRWRR